MRNSGGAVNGLPCNLGLYFMELSLPGPAARSVRQRTARLRECRECYVRWDTYGNDSHILPAGASSHATGAVPVPSPQQKPYSSKHCRWRSVTGCFRT